MKCLYLVLLDPTGWAGHDGCAVEASAQRVRNHLRRPFPAAETYNETAGTPFGAQQDDGPTR